MLPVDVSCLSVHDFTVVAYCMLLHLVFSFSMRVLLQKMTRENHIVDEQSQIIFIKSSHLHYIEEANDKTNECFFGGI